MHWSYIVFVSRHRWSRLSSLLPVSLSQLSSSCEAFVVILDWSRLVSISLVRTFLSIDVSRDLISNDSNWIIFPRSLIFSRSFIFHCGSFHATVAGIIELVATTSDQSRVRALNGYLLVFDQS